MTRKEIILNTKRDEFERGTCRIFVNFFDQYIPCILFQDHDKFNAVYSEIIMNTSSNDLISLIIKDGKIVSLNNDGAYFDMIEEN